MKDSQKRPLIGLLVLLAGLFILSEFLPRNVPESGEAGVPSTTLPLAANSSSGADAEALDADTPAAPPAPDAKVAQAPETGAPRPVDASALPLAASATVPRPAPQPHAQQPAAPPAGAYQAPPTSVSSMSSYSAQESQESRPPPPPKPAAARPVEVKPIQAAPAETRPREAPKAEAKPAAPQVPALKLAQSLPAPTKAPPPPPPLPAKPIPPPAPPIPKLATSVQALPPPVAAGQGRLWYVQIGSFADQGNAQTTLNLLQNIGFRGESSKASTSAGGAVYRVRLGPFPSEAVAQQALSKVSHQGYPQARVLSEASSAR
jgi:cell division septation protein DedD